MLGVNVYLAVTYLNLVAVNMFRNLQWEQDKHMITFAEEQDQHMQTFAVGTGHV